MSAKLTICTVSFGHKQLIEENINFVSQMNPEALVQWIIVENAPHDNNERFEVGERGLVKVVEGVENTFSGIARASQHHAAGLNLALAQVQTRFALVLDPDFYIVRKGWIREVIEHMEVNNLGFFGAPYNPKRYLKYRYFPCIHCMFIDLEKISKDKLDFRPNYQ